MLCYPHLANQMLRFSRTFFFSNWPRSPKPNLTSNITKIGCCDIIIHVSRSLTKSWISIQNSRTICAQLKRELTSSEDPPHCDGGIQKRRFRTQDASNVFRSHFAGQIQKLSFWICVKRPKVGKSHDFLDVIVSKTEMKSHRFQIPPIWRWFSKSSVLWQISVDDRPNRRNRATFTNSTGAMRTGPDSHTSDSQFSSTSRNWKRGFQVRRTHEEQENLVSPKSLTSLSAFVNTLLCSCCFLIGLSRFLSPSGFF